MTPQEKLKALLAAKKAGAQNVPVENKVPSEAVTAGNVPVQESKSVVAEQSGQNSEQQQSSIPVPDASASISPAQTDASNSESGKVEQPKSTGVSGTSVQSVVQQDGHPIRMQLAELEAALLEKIPTFKVVLRDIHAKLRNDTELVTALNDEEIGLLLKGLTEMAQIEVVAPKAAKSSRAAVKNTIISADDL